MKLPNWLKVAWWIVLLSLITYLLYQRYNAFVDGNTTWLDVFAFIIWVSLLLAPIFQEVEFFGVKLKQEIEEIKDEMSEQILSLRTDLVNAISVRTSINPQFNFAPPPDSRLPEMEERFRSIIEETLRAQGVQGPEYLETIEEVSDDVMFLFTVRHQIERELRRIWQERFNERDSRRIIPINQITNALTESGLVDSNLSGVIREVYSVCSPAIHGEDISKNQVEFVRDIAPRLVTTLRRI